MTICNSLKLSIENKFFKNSNQSYPEGVRAINYKQSRKQFLLNVCCFVDVCQIEEK